IPTDRLAHRLLSHREEPAAPSRRHRQTLRGPGSIRSVGAGKGGNAMFWRLRSLMLGIILGLLFSPGTGTENRRRFWLWLQGAAGQAAPKVQTQLQQVATKGSAVASQTLD